MKRKLIWISTLLTLLLLGLISMGQAQTNNVSCEDITEIPLTECEALLTFYNSTNGPNWPEHKQWFVNDQPCTWWSLFCTDGHITLLEAAEYEMQGSIPPVISQLTYLTHLSLGGSLNGPIPIEIGELANLQQLDFSQAFELNAPIPPELGDLSNLETFRIEFAAITGVIPPELGNLTNLQTFYVLGTDLTGPIPPELGNLANLERLIIAHTDLTGSIPPELGNLANLEEFFLASTELNGTIPTELSNLTNLQEFGIWDTPVSGAIPSELGTLTNLRRLELVNTSLSGDIPPALSNLANLEWLIVSGSQISGSLPPELGDLNNLSVLRLNRNRLTGNVPAELGNLMNLEVLDLGHNQLEGQIPVELGGLPVLQHLNLSNNALSGSLPPELGNLAALVSLFLHDNPWLAGPLSGSLITMTALEDFDFSQTSLCVPEDPALIAWLNQIEDLEPSGFTCTPSVNISAAGGSLLSHDGQVEIEFPAGAFTETTAVTYTQFAANLPLADLAGVERFFVLEAVQDSVVITQTLTPMTITVSYAAQNPLITDTIQLYYFAPTGWLHEGISSVSQTENSLTSLSDLLDLYAVLGETYRYYLPILQRENMPVPGYR